MMQTLIGADGVVMTLSGRLEISSALTCLPGLNDASHRTVIEAYPGVGVLTQRVVLNGLRVLDVETLPSRPRPVVTVERNDPKWCYWCDRPRTECMCHLDPNGIPANHWRKI